MGTPPPEREQETLDSVAEAKLSTRSRRRKHLAAGVATPAGMSFWRRELAYPPPRGLPDPGGDTSPAGRRRIPLRDGPESHYRSASGRV